MNSGSSNNNEKGVEVRTHDIPVADAMSEFMKQGWAESPLTGIAPHPSIFIFHIYTTKKTFISAVNVLKYFIRY